MSSASNPVSQPVVSPLDVERRELRTQEQKAHEPSMEEILASIRRIIADDKALPIARKGATSLLSEKAQHLAAMQNLAHAGSDKAGSDKASSDKPSSAAVSESSTPAPQVVAPQILPSPALSQPASGTDVAAPASPALGSVSAALEPLILDAPAQTAAEPPQDQSGVHPVLAGDDAAFGFDGEEADAIFDLAQMPQLRATQPARVQGGADAAAMGLNAILQGNETAFASQSLANATAAPGAEPLASPFTDASVASSFDALSKSMMLNNKTLIEDLTREMLRPMLKSWLDDNLPVMVERLVRAEIERVARGGRG